MIFDDDVEEKFIKYQIKAIIPLGKIKYNLFFDWW